MRNSIWKHLTLFLIGGLLYLLIEIMWRGYTHWTMFVLGGICFVCIGLLNEVIPWEMPLIKQGMIGAVLITALEFVSGCIVNIWLKWDVWDYSDIPFNIGGQVCLPFFILWFFAALAAIILDDYMRCWLFGEEKPHYTLFK